MIRRNTEGKYARTRYPWPIRILTCVGCGANFTRKGKSATAKYCNQACYHGSKRAA